MLSDPQFWVAIAFVTFVISSLILLSLFSKTELILGSEMRHKKMNKNVNVNTNQKSCEIKNSGFN